VQQNLYSFINYIQIIFIDILDRGNMTCQRRPGSLGYEVKDANTYAAWGVDYLKLDSCNTNGTPAEVEYSIMRDALNASGRPIFYSLCGMHTNCLHFL
jgi:alpha-galactosidase